MDYCSNYASFFKDDLAYHHHQRQQYRRLLEPSKKVSVITVTNKPEFIRNIFDNYQRQAYLNKEFLVVLNNNGMDLTQWQAAGKEIAGVRIWQLDESVTLGECLNFAVDQSDGDYIAKFDDDDFYGPLFLVDSLSCFYYTEAPFVGKTAHLIYFKQRSQLYTDYNIPGNQYVDRIYGGTQLIKKEVFRQVRFPHVNLGEDLVFNAECGQKGILMYATDPFNYVRIRHGKSHTWVIDDEEYITTRKLTFLADCTNYQAYAQV